MSRRSRHLRRWLGAILAASLALGCGSDQRKLDALRAPDVNVLLVSVDTLRASHLGCYGYERATSPNIDALAASGVTFLRSYSPRGLTFPSIASLLTSQYPYSHGVLTMPKTALAEAHETLAEALRARGYRTAGFTAHLALTPEAGFAQGFHDYFLFHGDHEDLMVERAGRWLENNREGPFFAWVHFFGPHSPYQPGPDWDRFSDPEYAGPYDGSQAQLYAVAEREELSDEDRAHILALYDGKLRRTDHLVGRLLDRLDALGLRERTLVVLTSDHGEELFDHHWHFSHEWSVYDGVLRVPLILSLPGRLPQGRVIEEQLVQLIDVMPTILDLSGEEASGPARQGRSLLPVIAGIDAGHEYVYGSIDFRETVLTLRTPRWRYVYNPDGPLQPKNIRIEPEELYDLNADPGERKNVVEEHPAVATALREELVSWKRRAEEQRGPERILDDPELEAQVRALGYAIDDDEATDVAALSLRLTDPGSLEERDAAAKALVELGAEAVPVLIGALADDEAAVRWLAADSLGQLGPSARAATPALLRALESPEAPVRWRAVQALAKIGGEDAERGLRIALEDEDEKVRSLARRSLERFEEDRGREEPGD